MITSQRRQWLEKRRWVALGTTLAAATAGFWLGPVNGLLVLPLMLGVLLAYGYATSRPVVRDPASEIRWTRLVYGFIFGFLPGLVVILVLSSAGVELGSVRGVPLDVVVLFSLYFMAAVGDAIAAVHIVRRRGTKVERERSKKIAWAFTISVGLLSLFSLMDFLFWRPYSNIDYFRVGLALGAPGALAIAILVVTACYRILVPVPEEAHRTPTLGPAPTFAPFRG